MPRTTRRLIVRRFGLGPSSFVVELASNDGYLLQYFVAAGRPRHGCRTGTATSPGWPWRRASRPGSISSARSWPRDLAAEGKRADLIIGNNVLAQVPDLNDFVRGMKVLLKPQGVITLEFPHLVRLMEGNQFDTIYHEHFSYFSLTAADKIFAAHGLGLFDVEELPTHGGSLRIYLPARGGWDETGRGEGRRASGAGRA